MKTTEENGDHVVFCDSCGTRVVWIQGDCIVIRQKHHQKQHTTVIPIETLLNLSKSSQIRKLVKSLV